MCTKVICVQTLPVVTLQFGGYTIENIIFECIVKNNKTNVVLIFIFKTGSMPGNSGNAVINRVESS